MDTPKYVVHEGDVPEVEGTYPAPFDAEKLSIYRDLGRAAGTTRVGLSKDRIPPGRRTSFTHAHEDEEEIIYVLKGTCAVRLIEPGAEPREIPLREGHVVSFPPGTGIAHCVVNHGDADCEVLVIGERRPTTDRYFYPEDKAYDDHVRANKPEKYWAR